MQGSPDEDPLAVANRIAAEMGGAPEAAAPPPGAPPTVPAPTEPAKAKPAFVIAGALARASVGGIVAWCLDKGAGYMLLRFGVRPGPASIPITWQMAEAFGVSESDRQIMGIIPERTLPDGTVIPGVNYEFQYSTVAAEACALEMERLGWQGDLRIHPLIILLGVVVATPITMYLRSPGPVETPRTSRRDIPADPEGSAG